MDIKKIKYNQELIKNKIKLEKELKMISKEIEDSQKSCNHIRVCLGWDGPYQYRDTSIHLCLLCREYDPDTKYKGIDATNYRKLIFSHGECESYREKRLLELQQLAMNTMLANPTITEEELIQKLTEIIEVDEEETKVIEKKLGYKFV